MGFLVRGRGGNTPTPLPPSKLPFPPPQRGGEGKATWREGRRREG